MRMTSAFTAVTALGACASTSAEPLIMSDSVALPVRQAATCYVFNNYAYNFVFGAQAEGTDFATEAEFWRQRFTEVEPNERTRQRLIESGAERMATDFPRRGVGSPNDGTQVEVYNAGYDAVISSCEAARSELERNNG